jgi:hypothetical protein
MTLTNELLGVFQTGSGVAFQDANADSLVSETGISYVFTLSLANALPKYGRVQIDWPSDWPQDYEPSDRYTVSCINSIGTCGYAQSGVEAAADASGYYLSRVTFTDGIDPYSGEAAQLVEPGPAHVLEIAAGKFTNPSFSGPKTFTVRTMSLDATGTLWGIDEATDPFVLDFTTGVLTIKSVVPTVRTIAATNGAYTISLQAQHAPQATDELIITWPLTFPL